MAEKSKMKNVMWASLGLLALTGCIKNDIPYPRIQQNIRTLAVEGQVRDASIDSVTQKATVYLDEVTDITQVKVTQFEITEGGTADPDILGETVNLSSTLFVTLSLYQDYVWEINAVQDIERYFEVEGELGASIVDPVAKRVVVTMPDGTDLSHLNLLRVKLGPEGITTYTPALEPGLLNLEYPRRVDVTAWGRSEIWTLYAEIADTPVSTTSVDAWSKVIWAYGSGPSGEENGFQYKKKDGADWIDVPKQYVTQTQGVFSCYIPHLEPLTEYSVRAVSKDTYGEEINVTTQATADIPDGDFEQWSQTDGMWNPWNLDGERYWDTGNKGASIVKVNLTEPTDHTVTGTGRAAKCSSKLVMIKLASGSIYTGEYLRTDITDGVLGFGRPWTLRPTKLRGYMQYESAAISKTSKELEYMKGQPDSCQIYVALTDWTEPFEIRTKTSNRQLFDPNASYVIAYGQLTFSGTQTGYVPFEIELKYNSTSRVPTYLQITCTASKYGDYFTGGDGSVLYVDQFSFDWDY